MEESVDALLSEENLQRARQLAVEIESGNRDKVLQLVAEISSLRENELLQDVGKLTRSLHDSVCNIGTGSNDSLFDTNEFPDARERLNHVIKLTEDSANTTLNCVEEVIPIVQESGASAAELLKRWKKLCNKELELSGFKQLSDDIQAYLHSTQNAANGLQSSLNDVLMAQGFQDLTGQMIRQVIALVDDVEDRLVQLVATNCTGVSGEGAQSEGNKREKMLKGEGPALPSAGNDTVDSQDEVDDLLASLGF